MKVVIYVDVLMTYISLASEKRKHMPWQEGVTPSFDFFDHQNVLRTASTEVVGGGWGNTDDPKWIVSGLGSTEWLDYKNSNGEDYTVKIHCRTMAGDQIRSWAETKHNGRTEGDVLGILVTDNAGPPGWTVEFLQLKKGNPVSFKLHHAILQGY